MINRKRSRQEYLSGAQIATRASELKHLSGYTDTASGGLSFGETHEIVKNPKNVFIVDHAIETVQESKPCTACEMDGCTSKATHGIDHPRALPRRCERHAKDSDMPILCMVAWCEQNAPLVKRQGTAKVICIWHALMDPGKYEFVRGAKICFCGDRVTFGISKKRMICASCSESANRQLGTELTHTQAGDCIFCSEKQGNDRVVRKSDGVIMKACRPCYNSLDTNVYKPGKRHDACHYKNCTKSAALKSEKDGRRACPKHAPTTEKYKHHTRPCRGDGCRKMAYYASTYPARPVACGEHRRAGEYAVTRHMCRVCLATQLDWYDAKQLCYKNKSGICRDCKKDGEGPVIRFYERTIVRAVITRVRETGLVFTKTNDVAISMHASDRAYRPDLVLRFSGKTVFLEVDEGEHRSYNCELAREAAIFSSVEDLESEKLMIRVNPDAGGTENTLFSKKPTVAELAAGLDPVSCTTSRFNQKVDEIVELIVRFEKGDVAPGHVHHINWTTPTPPRMIRCHM